MLNYVMLTLVYKMLRFQNKSYIPISTQLDDMHFLVKFSLCLNLTKTTKHMLDSYEEDKDRR